MRQIFRNIVMALSGCVLPTMAVSQGSFDAAENRSFASENAILDTSVPFAIGAREAQQALRGSFGWPSFQEGLVEGVYFRFDPDGYARFAPTPRLDVDVFEVICRPRTYSCAARKEGLEMFLNERRQIQLKIDNVVAGDTFHVVEGVSEIQVPERVVQPLDLQLETLLSSGGELSARRGGNEISRISLKGFAAVSAYLRWIAARQDYAVLPRGWPVPNGRTGEEIGLVTQPGSWASPMPQPQVLALEPVVTSPSSPTEGAESTLALRAEIAELKQLLKSDSTALPMEAASTPSFESAATPARSHAPSMQVSDLIETIAELQAEVANLRTSRQAPLSLTSAKPELRTEMKTETIDVNVTEKGSNTPEVTAERLEFLMQELGLDLQTAVTVIQMAEPAATGQETTSAGVVTPAVTGETQVLYQTSIVDEILAALEAEIELPETGEASDKAGTERPSVTEYQLLTKYFASVALPALEDFANKE